MIGMEYHMFHRYYICANTDPAQHAITAGISSTAGDLDRDLYNVSKASDNELLSQKKVIESFLLVFPRRALHWRHHDGLGGRRNLANKTSDSSSWRRRSPP